MFTLGHLSYLLFPLNHYLPNNSTNPITSAPQPAALVFARSKRERGRREAGRIADWGAPGDTAESAAFVAPRGGRHEIAVAYANGTGPINTGIACGVKRAEVVHAATGRVVASGHLVMPQLATWERVEPSSPLFAALEAGERYLVRLSEDEFARNMTYLAHNARYTSWPGGSDQSHNRVHVAGLRVTALD